jgi:hypothetical protein
VPLWPEGQGVRTKHESTRHGLPDLRKAHRIPFASIAWNSTRWIRSVDSVQHVMHRRTQITQGQRCRQGIRKIKPAMNQSRLSSLSETCLSIAVGFAVSVGLTALVLPAYGHAVTLGDNLQITAIFTVASVARGYVVRRAFNRWGRA